MATPCLSRPPRRVAVYGFHHPELQPVIARLRDEAGWDVPLWYGSGPGQIWSGEIERWHLGDFAAEVTAAAIPDPASTGAAVAAANEPEALEVFLDQIARNPAMIDQPFVRYRMLWTDALTQFSGALRRHRIDRVIFQNLPHEGFEWALYCAAQRLGLETLLLYQTVLPGRFCYCWSLADFGTWAGVAPSPQTPPLSVERRFEKDLFYMRDVAGSGSPGANWGERWRVHSRVARLRWRRRLEAWKQAAGIDRLRGKPARPLHPAEDYQLDLQRQTASVDWSQRFVYFPLHLQPELTTATLGDRYRDQLLAIEQLRLQLDPQTWIYVKENPKQSYRWRGPGFFERLRRIPRTRLVARTTDTYRLLRESQFAATVTGTVGWESISGGKSVLVFGRPWYLSLAGVYRFCPQQPIPADLGHPIDAAEFEGSLQRLSRYLPLGLVDLAYRSMLPSYQSAENQQQIFDFLRAAQPA